MDIIDLINTTLAKSAASNSLTCFASGHYQGSMIYFDIQDKLGKKSLLGDRKIIYGSVSIGVYDTYWEIHKKDLVLSAFDVTPSIYHNFSNDLIGAVLIAVSVIMEQDIVLFEFDRFILKILNDQNWVRESDGSICELRFLLEDKIFSFYPDGSIELIQLNAFTL